jgi:LAS superfamily LD-carboxypeptidase LdcB
MMKNILLVFICLLSFSVFSQNQKSSTLDYKKTEKSENGLSEKKKKKKKKKDENPSKTDYSVKTKKETKKRKAKNSAPHIDASQTRKNTARKVSNKL